MSWFGGIILLSVYATGSGRSVRDEPEALGDCHKFPSVAKMVGSCIPSAYRHLIKFDEEYLDPSTLLFLNGALCVGRDTMDMCLVGKLAHCENRLEIIGYVSQTRPLCNDTDLTQWFKDAVTSLPSIRYQCAWDQLSNALHGVCAGVMRVGDFDYSLEEGIIEAEIFLSTALGCLLRNMEELYGQSPTCSGVDMKRAMFAAVALINGLPAPYVFFQFRASHLQQIKDALLPFESQVLGYQDII